jgi:hypothetical protein
LTFSDANGRNFYSYEYVNDIFSFELSAKTLKIETVTLRKFGSTLGWKLTDILNHRTSCRLPRGFMETER